MVLWYHCKAFLNYLNYHPIIKLTLRIKVLILLSWVKTNYYTQHRSVFHELLHAFHGTSLANEENKK